MPVLASHHYNGSNTTQSQDHSLPYQTTSTQAMETSLQSKEMLAAGVSYGVSRLQRNHQHKHRVASSKTKGMKKKSSSRFTLCGCGNNIDLYDDGSSPTVNAPAIYDEKIIGQLYHSTIPALPSTTYTKRIETEAGDQYRAPTTNESGFSALHPSIPPFTQEQKVIKGSDECAPYLVSVETFKSEEAIVPKASRVKRSIEKDYICTETQPVSQSTSRTPLICAAPQAQQDGFYQATQPRSSSTLVEESKVMPVQRQRRRGGFIGASSSSIPVIDIIEAPHVLQDSFDNPQSQPTHVPVRSSIASTISKYSVMSPCIEHTSTPSRATMGGLAGGVGSIPPFNSADRSSYSSTTGSLSIDNNSSLHESERSPAIGEVLSHFPALPGMTRSNSSALSSYIDEINDQEEADLPKRINTFGLDRLRSYDYQKDYNLHRINSFHYDDKGDDLFQRPASSCDSYPSSSDSIQTDSSGLSRRSHKRTAVMCRLPSHHDLAALSRCSDVGDLTWEEKLLTLSRGRSSSSISTNVDEISDKSGCNSPDVDDTIEFAGDETISQRCSKETLRSTTTRCYKKIQRGSATTHHAGPFSPPPNVPLPPIPSSKRKTRPQQLRSPKSLLAMATQHHSFPALSSSQRATLSRSTTCPDLADTGYAY